MFPPCFAGSEAENLGCSAHFRLEGTHSQQDGLGRLRRGSTRFAQWNSLCWEALGRCLENLGWEQGTVLRNALTVLIHSVQID